MKNALVIFFFCIIQATGLAQKVTVKVIIEEYRTRSEWQIMDEAYNPVISSVDYPGCDTVTVSLDADTRYIFSISVPDNQKTGIRICSLILNAEPIMLINDDIGSGDHLFPFFTGIRDKENKITGGTTAPLSDFPWQVYYISGDGRCGGSIIADNWVVTAAHCTKDQFGNSIPVTKMFIKAGANNPRNSLEGITYIVNEVIVHEKYNDQTHDNDIAVLRLQQPINPSYGTPIKLITSQDVAYGATNPGVLSWVTGWGSVQVNPNVFPTSLQKVQLPIVTNVQASLVWSSIPATSVMAGYLNGNKDACFGDSGGPMAVPVFGEYKLAGIVSWGSQNCNTYGGYTRVSAMESWIREKTGIPKEYWPPEPSGDNIICQGQITSQYSIPVQTGATNYEWKLSPAASGSITGDSQNATVLWNPAFTGSVTLLVRVTIDNKVSEWSRLIINVVLNTKLLNQSSDTSICAGNPIWLNVSAEGYNLSYKWYKNGIQIQSGISSVLNIPSTNADNSGTYKCEIKGFCNTVFSENINLTVYPLTKITFISPDVSVTFGNDLILQVTSEGHNLSYLWQKDDVNIENSNVSKLYLYELDANDIGLYSTTVTGTCGTKNSNPVYVYVNKEEFSGSTEVLLWPSVTRSEFNVALSNDAFYNVSVFNTLGQKMKELKNCRYQTKIDVSDYPRGVYIVTVDNNVIRESIKIIKE